MNFHLNHKDTRLFIVLAGFFISNALIAEIVGVKIFSFERLMGWEDANWSFFGEEKLSFSLTVGVILWPVVFIMTDIINEYFGKRGVRFLSYLTVGLIGYAFLMFAIAINLPAAEWWPSSHLQQYTDTTLKTAQAAKVGDYDFAYGLVLGQGNWIIIGSLVAFLIGQIVDVTVFQAIKKKTGEGKLWLRATGSTLISQFIDSFVVLFIAFYIGANWGFAKVMAICLMNYIYKFIVAVLLTPSLYLIHRWIDKYLGKDLSASMRAEAQLDSNG